MEKLHAAMGESMLEHQRHKDATPIVVRHAEHVLKVKWNKSTQLWRVLYARGLVRVFCADGGYISDGVALSIAKQIIRSAIK